jgi:predicted RNA-binding protein with RPS1 domain
MSAPFKSCLILGSRQALERLDPVLDQALAVLDLSRVWPPAPEDMVKALREVDVILAEVTKPSPAISFALGVATALGTPLAYIATDQSRLSPVFRRVLIYDVDLPAPKLAFVFAKLIDEALMESPSGAQPAAVDYLAPRGYAEPLPADDDSWLTEYGVGERFEGVIAHVDTVGGFVLVSSPGRSTTMLHVSNMTTSKAAAFSEGRLSPGDPISVEVIAVDNQRRQVQLRDVVTITSPSSSNDARLADTTRILQAWSAIQYAVNVAENESAKPGPVLQRWFNLYEPEIAVLRDVRNRLAHAEHVSETELAKAIEYADEVQSRLEQALQIYPVTCEQRPAMQDSPNPPQDKSIVVHDALATAEYGVDGVLTGRQDLARVLEELYLRQGLSIRQMAAHLGLSNRAVWRELKNAGIPRRSVGVRGTVLDPEVLRDLYVNERLSINQVAARLGVARSVVERNLRANSITRTRRQRLPKELLEELYVNRRLSAEAVATRVGCSTENVLADLRYWGLPRRRAGRGPKPLTRGFAERVYKDLLGDMDQIDSPGPDLRGEGPAGDVSE